MYENIVDGMGDMMCGRCGPSARIRVEHLIIKWNIIFVFLYEILCDV